MKLVSSPYRWLPRTFLPNLRGWYYDIYYGISNLRTFFEAVWWFRAWDWDGLAGLIETSAREMRKSHLPGHLLRAPRTAKQLLIVAELCKRLRENVYFEQAGYDPKTWDKRDRFTRQKLAKHSGYMAAQDAKYLGKMMQRITHWWD